MRRIGRPRIRRWSTDRLIQLALAQGSSPRAWAAIALLHARGSSSMLARIEALVRSPSVRRRALGLDIAAQLRTGPAGNYQGEPYALETPQATLIAGLDDIHPSVVQSAIAGLGHRPAPAALPALLANLRHVDARIRFALASTLGHYQHLEATAALLELARDRDDDVRDWATFSLGMISEVDSDEIRALLWINAQDPNRDVRGEAVVGLARRSDPRVTALLHERLDDDCRVYELEAVEEMPRPELLEPLHRLRDSAVTERNVNTYWYGCLLRAIDACETMADAAA